jgi:hypothetical protein
LVKEPNSDKKSKHSGLGGPWGGDDAAISDLNALPHHGGGGRTTAEAAGDHRAEESAAMLT